MKTKGTKIVDITIEEKALEDEMPSDDIERILKLMARWVVRIARKKAINSRGTGGRVITLNISNGYVREIGDQ